MEFVYPNFLWALFALAIPIAIHLFNFRKYTTLLYSDVSLLKNVQQKTNKQRNLKHLLVLLLRMLTIIFLVLAFSKPFVPAKENTENKKVVLLIDNSPSMLAQDKFGENLNYAKLQAKKVIESYGNTNKYRLLTHSQDPRHNIWLSKADAIEEVSNIDISDNSSDISTLINSIQEYDVVYVFSDLQKSNVKLADLGKETKMFFVSLPTQSIRENLSIDSVWIESPIALSGFEQTIYARVYNHSSEAVTDLSVSLMINEQQAGVQTAEVSPLNYMDVQFKYIPKQSGYLNGSIQVVGPNFRFDDEYFFALPIKGKRKVVNLYQEYPNAIIENDFDDDLIDLSSFGVNNVNVNRIAEADLVILDHIDNISTSLLQNLKQSVNGNLLIIPGENGLGGNLNDLMSQFQLPAIKELRSTESVISTINYKDPYFSAAFGKESENLNIKGVERYYSIGVCQNCFELVNLRNSDPIALKKENGASLVVLLLSGLTKEYGNWYQSNLIYPLLYQSAIVSGKGTNISFNTNTLGLYAVKKASESDLPVRVQFKSNDFIPRQVENKSNVIISLDEQFRQVGYYNVLDQNEIIGAIAMNYPAKESSIQFLKEQDFEPYSNWIWLEGSVEEISRSVEEIILGINYWKHCLLMALLFLFLEGLVLRFMKSV
jgi:hypothetical protein